MDEVFKTPTAGDIDDYSEFKRLRKINRDSQKKEIDISTGASKSVPSPAKMAPTISPHKAPLSLEKRSWLTNSSNPSRTSVLTGSPSLKFSKVPPYDTAFHTPRIVGDEGVLNVPGRPALSRQETHYTRRLPDQPPILEGGDVEPTTSTSRVCQNLKEVAPWIDVELPSLTITSTNEVLRLNILRSHNNVTPDQLEASKAIHYDLSRKNSGDRDSTSSLGVGSGKQKKKERVNSFMARSINPIVETLDRHNAGPIKAVDFFFPQRPRAASTSSTRNFAAGKQPARTNSMPSNTISIKSERRDAVVYPHGHVISPITSAVDSNIQDTHLRQHTEHNLFKQSLPRIKKFQSDYFEDSVGVANRHTPKSSLGTTQTNTLHCNSSHNDEAVRTQSTDLPKTTVKETKGEKSKVTFRDPFGTPSRNHGNGSSDKSSPSPGTVL